MCAILDASVVTAVFGGDAPPGAREFRRWIDSGRGRLAVGGLLRRELSSNDLFKSWLQQALLRGRARNVADDEVDREAAALEARESCRSNDEHVVALARLSGARLLYSRDHDLREDFKDARLLKAPRGKVYPENQGAKCRRWLLRQPDLCAR